MLMTDMTKLCVSTVTMPDMPDKYGIIYTEDVFNQYVSEFYKKGFTYIPIIKEDHKGQFISKVNDVLIDITEVSRHGTIYGTISELYADHIIMDIETDKVQEFKNLLSEGYSMDMMYIADIDMATHHISKFKNIVYYSLRKD